MKSWTDFQPHQKLGVRKILAKLVSESSDKELTHEMIEEALQAFPEFDDCTVEDDWYHFLITEIYDEYRRLGAVEE